MGTITSRKRSDGTVGHTAQIRVKRDGEIIHSEAKTFDRKAAARLNSSSVGRELLSPGAIERAKIPDATLKDAIDKSRREAGEQQLVRFAERSTDDHRIDAATSDEPMFPYSTDAIDAAFT